MVQQGTEEVDRGAIILAQIDRPDFEPRSLDYIEFLSWETSRISLGGGSFTFLSAFEGDLDKSILLRAWRLLCRRHPMLGATIEERGGAPFFVPLPCFPDPVVRISSSDDLAEELLSLIGELEFSQGSPLYCPFAILNLHTGRHVFATVINHAAGDGHACHKLHKEFSDLLNAPKDDEEGSVLLNRALPRSWCELLLPKPRPWTFVRSGIRELTRPTHCKLVPFENVAPFAQRRNRHMIVVADLASTRAVIQQASQEYGINAFLSARLLQAQHAYMTSRGLAKNRARLVLSLPTDLRRFSSPNGDISMATFPHFLGIDIQQSEAPSVVAQRVRAAIDLHAGPRGLDHLVNWHIPALTRSGLRRIIRSNLHFGPYTTHLGRTDLGGKKERVFRVAAFGFLNMRHGLSWLQAATKVENGQLVVEMNYCEPVVSADTAETFFREFLDRIGIDPRIPITADYDQYLTIRQNERRSTPQTRH